MPLLIPSSHSQDMHPEPILSAMRQCLVDRRYFKGHLAQWLEQRAVQTPGPQFPWAWAEGRDRVVIPSGSSVLHMASCTRHMIIQSSSCASFVVLVCSLANRQLNLQERVVKATATGHGSPRSHVVNMYTACEHLEPEDAEW